MLAAESSCKRTPTPMQKALPIMLGTELHPGSLSTSCRLQSRLFWKGAILA